MMKKPIKTALIASGGGTDAFAIMNHRHEITEIDLCLLVSTKEGAPCLNKAAKCKVPAITLDRENLGSIRFDYELAEVLKNNGIRLVFLVGCIVKIPPVEGVVFYNIHPANIEKFGGRKMYGLEPHKKVLAEIEDLIYRGRKTINDRFYTEISVHEAVSEFDTGSRLVSLFVEIPPGIIKEWLGQEKNEKKVAGALQSHVLNYEWELLPFAVKIAAQKWREKNWLW